MAAVHCILIISFVCIVGFANAKVANSSSTFESDRDAKSGLGVFTVVKFANAPCAGTNGFNGTCYSESECTAKGGSVSGACASGFGVCCVFTMGCGTSSAQNCTYHTISSYNTASDPSPCTYKICPCSNNICKIRIDFDSFTISGPTTNTLATAAASTGPAVGDCTTDSFTVTVPGGNSPPVICGLNTGQHMYIDPSDQCNDLAFNIDQSTVTARSWSLKVTQYECGTDVPGIVDDCLQYFTGLSGTFSTYNWDTSVDNSAMTTANTHLSSQDYSTCFRQERGYCQICFSPAISPGGSTFSVSASADAAAAQGGVDATCTGIGVYSDYISVTNLSPAPTAAIATDGVNRVCGNFFSTIDAATASITACTAHAPFRWRTFFDDGEVAANPSANALNTAENADQGGMTGFNMDWFLVAC